MAIRYRYEYRINKKGAECFRTNDRQTCLRQLSKLNDTRPVYTMQERCMRYGGYIDKPYWSPWKEVQS